MSVLLHHALGTMMREPAWHTREILRGLLGDYCRGVVLDAGAGTTKYRALIEEHASRYIACDNWPDARLTLMATLNRLPFRGASFDTVICTMVLEHDPNPLASLAELRRVLKPGGHMIIATPWVLPFHAIPADYWRFSHEGMTRLLQSFGFEVVASRSEGDRLVTLVGVAKWLFPLVKKVSRWWGPVARCYSRFCYKAEAVHPSAMGYTFVVRRP